MAGNFFGGEFFGGGFFGENASDQHGKGDNDKRHHPYKPTGLLHRPTKPKAKDARVQERLDDSVAIEAEIADKLAREFGDEAAKLRQSEDATEAQAIVQMSMAEVDREIGILLRKKLRTEEEEITMLLLIAAAA